MKAFLLASGSLWRREFVRFYRQRNRVIGAIAPPLFLWILVGSGMGSSFRSSGLGEMNYLEYFYPGIVALTALFTSIFSAMSLIEDRRDGFLQGILVSPMPRSAIICGKALGGTSQGVVQGLSLLVVAPFIGISLTISMILSAVAALVLLSFGLTAFGILAAWRTDSIAGFHAVMNFILMPMWLLSGAFFPMEGAAEWLRWLMRLNPMTYGVAALRSGFYPTSEALSAFGRSAGVMFAFGAAMFALAVVMASRPARSS